MAIASFVGAGDLMINRAEPRSMLRHVERTLQEADVTYVNLEGPMCDVGEKNQGLAGIARHVRSSPRTIDALEHAGVDVVSLANNHTMDYGAAGLEQTLRLLDQAKIPYCGAGRNLDEARRPVSVQANGLKVAFLSYTSVCVPSYAATKDGPGAAVVRVKTAYEANLRLLLQPGSPMATKTVGNPEDVRLLVDEVKAAKADADAVIVAWHWGVSERWGKLIDYQRDLGRAVIDAGASAILGHHAHMLLGVEFYRNRPIFYSLGNFAFDMTHHYFRRESVIVQFDVSRDGLANVRVLPLMINEDHEPVPANDGDAQKVAWLLEYHSEGLNTKFINRGRHIELLPLI